MFGWLTWRRAIAAAVVAASVAALWSYRPEAGHVAAAFVVNSVVCALAVRWACSTPRRRAPPENPLLAKYQETGQCPDCGGNLMSGPRGGCCINVMCDTCGARFNTGWVDQWPIYMERI
jgi:hypothetical protein